MEVSESLYPFRENWLELDGGVRMHYVDEGEPTAPPVLMLHGNPTWSFYWRRLIRRLSSSGYRVIAPDHIGCGKSEKPSDSRYAYRLERRIGDLEHLVKHLDLGSLTMAVHDWGGMIGFGWAHRHPELVERLIVLNTAAFPLPETKKLPASLWLVRNTAVGAMLALGLNAFSRGAVYLAVKKPLPKEVKRGLLAPYDSWSNRRAVLRFVQDIPLSESDPGYEIVQQSADQLDRFDDLPVLICWGEKDFVFDEHFLQEWLKKLPNAELHRFPDSGHYVLEDSGPEIESLVADFMERTSITAPAPP